jgi:hypothetical protein
VTGQACPVTWASRRTASGGPGGRWFDERLAHGEAILLTVTASDPANSLSQTFPVCERAHSIRPRADGDHSSRQPHVAITARVADMHFLAVGQDARPSVRERMFCRVTQSPREPKVRLRAAGSNPRTIELALVGVWVRVKDAAGSDTGDRQFRRGLSAAVCVWSSSAAGSAPAHARSPTTCPGVPGAPRCHQTPRFEVRELGEIDMVSMALATLDLVAHDDARPAFPAVYLEGHTVLSYGELAGLAGESGRVLRHDSKALVLCAGDRDLATLLAYLAALRLGHADRLSGPLVALQDGDGTRLPLFLIHTDSGQAGPYCRLADALGEEFAVSGLQAGGLYSGAEPRRTVPAMAGTYAGVRLVAVIGTGLLEPPDTGTGFWWDEPPRQPGAWPARCASCSADQR